MLLGRPYLGQLLIKKKLITEEDLENALRTKGQSTEFIGKILLDMQLITEDELHMVLAEQLDIPFISLDQVTVDRNVLKTLSSEIIYRLGIIPVKWEGHDLCIAASNPNDPALLSELRNVLRCGVRFYLASPRDIANAINACYGPNSEPAAQGTDITENFRAVFEDIAGLSDNNDDAVIRLVDHILINAYQNRATDIHFEPYEDEFRIRYRVDGLLYALPASPKAKKFQAAITSRIKVMAGMNIAERRVPQDGRMTVKIGDGALNLRISVLPTPFGESVQVRLFSTHLMQLEELGLAPQELMAIEEVLCKPHGIMFVTGPTGSGKTTTLYACLQRLNSAARKIVTIEDPIEYRLKGITQVQAHQEVGLTFATALRSMLRHDPDVMLVGEVRDPETATIATNIALTGHLVLSTIHSNDAAGIFARLLDMGIEPHLIASSIECVVAQSLVRVLCPHCKAAELLSDEMIQMMGLTDSRASFAARGCPLCQHTGYRGRTLISEIVRMDDDLRKLVLRRAPTQEIQQSIREKGVFTLRQNGFEKVKQGITSVAEVLEASYS